MVGKKVVVTTEHRGVFFGTLAEVDGDKQTCRLSDAHVCVYWSSNVRGFIGLAVTGPDADSRVSKAAPTLDLFKVTSLTECTDAAVAAWEAAPWG